LHAVELSVHLQDQVISTPFGNRAKYDDAMAKSLEGNGRFGDRTLLVRGQHEANTSSPNGQNP
jgi:hypothetical protein